MNYGAHAPDSGPKAAAAFAHFAITLDVNASDPLAFWRTAVGVAYDCIATTLDLGSLGDLDAYVLSRALDAVAVAQRLLADDPVNAEGALRTAGALLGETADRSDLVDVHELLVSRAIEALALALDG
jgi:hypothetical protein